MYKKRAKPRLETQQLSQSTMIRFQPQPIHYEIVEDIRSTNITCNKQLITLRKVFIIIIVYYILFF